MISLLLGGGKEQEKGNENRCVPRGQNRGNHFSFGEKKFFWRKEHYTGQVFHCGFRIPFLRHSTKGTGSRDIFRIPFSVQKRNRPRKWLINFHLAFIENFRGFRLPEHIRTCGDQKQAHESARVKDGSMFRLSQHFIPALHLSLNTVSYRYYRYIMQTRRICFYLTAYVYRKFKSYEGFLPCSKIRAKL